MHQRNYIHPVFDINHIARLCGGVIIAAVFLGSPRQAEAGVDLQEGNSDEAQRLRQIEARIERLTADNDEIRLSERRTEEVRALVTEIMNDSDTRTSMQSSGFQAGYDDGFIIQDADGRFKLEVSGRIQFRYTLSRRKQSPVDNSRGGFEPRRVKIGVNGHLIDPRLTYKVTVARDRFKAGAFGLETMYINFQATDELAFRVGNFRSPLLKEESVSSKRQLLVERSQVARTFIQDRTQGLMIRYEAEKWRTFLAVMDASRELFMSENWVYAVRGEWLIMGKWKNLKDFTSFPDDEPTVALGAGILYQKLQPHVVGESNQRILRWTVDATVELGGANIMAAFISNRVREVGSIELNQYGAVIQGGVFLNDVWEIFGRGEWGDADHADPYLSTITVGANRFFEGHRLKATADVGYAFNEVGSLWESDGTGWQQDLPGQDGQIVARMQFQLLF